MDSEKTINLESIDQDLKDIKSLLQSLIIIQGGSAGLNRDQVRELAGVNTQRVSKIWSNFKKTKITEKVKS